MKRSTIIRTLLLMGLAALFFFACQSKEVTSARVYIQQDNWDKAIEQLELAVVNYPSDPEAHYLLGWGYANREDWEAMNEMFDKSLALSPQFETEISAIRDQKWVEAFNTGVKMINDEDYDKAIDKFKEAIQINAKRPESYTNLAITLIRADRMEEAVDAYKKLIEIKPQDLKAMNELSRLYMQMERFEDTIALEKQVLEIDPTNSDAVYNLALAYDYMGEGEKAREQYEIALERNPDDIDMIFNVARLYFVSGNYQRAIELFQRVISANPDDYESNLNVGNAFLTMADDYRKKLVQKERDNEIVTEAELEQMKELYQQAIPYLEKAISINDGDSNVWTNLGVAYVNVGDMVKGQECFDRAEQIK
ncbi:tetratricopeptide repeat protein [candidate division KSB1 bacterium]|nr:tetratricopeptide repeat protein [candidate division KSB1 bacterium]